MRAFATALLITTTIFLSACGSDSSDAAGTYTLDKTAMKALLEEKMGPGSAAMLERMNIEVTLNADGSFAVKADEDGKGGAKGTWELDGTKLLVTTTHQNGEKEEKPETLTGKLEGDVITFRPKKDMPFDLILKKK